MAPRAATPIEIFRAGTHTAASGKELTFTDADLLAIAGGYDPARHEAPIVVGHPATDAPAYGWISGLQVEGGRLQASVAQLDPAFADLVQTGRFKKISASFYAPDSAANPTPGKWALKHVGFLGATPPAVKGLKQVAFSADEAGVETFAESWTLGLVAKLFGGVREFIIAKFGSEEADKTLPRDTIDWIATAEPPVPPPAFAEPPQPKDLPMPEPDPAAAAAAAALDQRKRDLDAAEAAFAERQRKVRSTEDTAFVADLVKQGRVPKGLASTASLLLARAGTGEAVSFAEGQATETDHAAMRRFLAALPTAVEFRELGAEGEPPAAGDTAESYRAAANALVKARRDAGEHLDFAEAITILRREKRA